MIKVKQYGDWVRAQIAITSAATTRLERAWNKSILKEAQLWRKHLVKGITKQAPGDQQFKPLSSATLAKRRSEGFKGRKALIRTGTYRRNIVVTKFPKMVFVGILRGVKTADGKELVNIARVHEEGRIVVIRVTEKMRKYFFAMLRRAGLTPATEAASKGGVTGSGLARGVLIIKIPARPVFGPVYDKMEKGKVRMVGRVKRNVGVFSKGEFGFSE